jgi:RNA recognition motif-containing protein
MESRGRRKVSVSVSSSAAAAHARAQYLALSDGEQRSAIRVGGVPFGVLESSVRAEFAGFRLPDGIDVEETPESDGPSGDVVGASQAPVLVCSKVDGSPAGDAYVAFASEEEAARALREKAGATLGGRTLELRVATRGEMYARRSMGGARAATGAAGALTVSGGASGGGSGSRGVAGGPMPSGTHVLKMRGLPFSAAEEDIRAFFAPAGARLHEPGGVHIVTRVDGRPTGEAFVAFDSEEEMGKAMTRKRERIGERYIELFHASVRDYQLAGFATPGGVVAGGAYGAAAVTGGLGRPDAAYRGVVRLRGLPFRARPEDVLNFFAGSGVTIQNDGIFLTSLPDGRASGEAFVVFTREADVTEAVKRDHSDMEGRWIQVAPSSKAEIFAALAPRRGGRGGGGDRKSVV